MRTRHTWTEEELAILRSSYSNTPAKKIAETLGRHTWSSVYAKAKELGLHRFRRPATDDLPTVTTVRL